jgi:hypothetical protein
MAGVPGGRPAMTGEVDRSNIAEAVRPGQPRADLATTSAGRLALVVELAPGATGPSVSVIWAHDFPTADLVATLVGTETESHGYLRGQPVRSEWLEAAPPGGLDMFSEHVVRPAADPLRRTGAGGVVLVPTGSLGFVPLHGATSSLGECGHSSIRSTSRTVRRRASCRAPRRGGAAAGSSARGLIAMTC